MRCCVPLADACVTEWRAMTASHDSKRARVPLADACVTEWRNKGNLAIMIELIKCHSLMLVLLNGGCLHGHKAGNMLRATR